MTGHEKYRYGIYFHVKIVCFIQNSENSKFVDSYQLLFIYFEIHNNVLNLRQDYYSYVFKVLLRPKTSS